MLPDRLIANKWLNRRQWQRTSFLFSFLTKCKQKSTNTSNSTPIDDFSEFSRFNSFQFLPSFCYLNLIGETDRIDSFASFSFWIVKCIWTQKIYHKKIVKKNLPRQRYARCHQPHWAHCSFPMPKCWRYYKKNEKIEQRKKKKKI